MSALARRPAEDEYDPFYAGYVGQVPDGDVVATLAQGLDSALALLGGVGEEQAGFRYAPGKWSLKEVVGHVVDIDRVFATRALLFARGDATELPGVEQDDLIAGAGFDRRSMGSLLDEYDHLRRSNLALFASLDEEALSRRGRASGCDFTVRSIPWIAAGHELHHLGVIRERYLGAGT